MKATLRKVLLPIAIIWFILLFIGGFFAYFVKSSGIGGLTDGLGRPLSDAPMMMRIFFGQERMWAGWLWFIGDMAIFYGSFALAINIGKRMED